MNSERDSTRKRLSGESGDNVPQGIWGANNGHEYEYQKGYV